MVIVMGIVIVIVRMLSFFLIKLEIVSMDKLLELFSDLRFRWLLFFPMFFIVMGL